MTIETGFRVLEQGTGAFRPPDPDGFRAFVREHKQRPMVSKLMSEHDAISRFVQDGDYLAYDCNMGRRGPTSLLREVIRQRKRNLWLAAKFTGNDADLLVAAGCVSRIDVGWMQVGRPIRDALERGELELIEWTNGAIAYRLLAGAMGVPFLPMRYVGGTDVFHQSGAMLVDDPYTGERVVLVPALNPDVAILHAYQCDEYGNARIFGPGIAPLETAMAAKRLIVSTEEIISNDEIRSDPTKTMLPYYLVDAVVEAPHGVYPGSMPGLYGSDTEHMVAFGRAMASGAMDAFLDHWVYSVESHMEMLERRVGATKLLALRKAAGSREGYYT
jgi:glutaconate CoA-transferase, subunit A